MNSNEALEHLLHSYEAYYNVSTQNVAAPFVAEASFKSHNEQYMLVKAAKIADIDSNEFVFFYINAAPACGGKGLTVEKITELSKIAWERGLSQVAPYHETFAWENGRASRFHKYYLLTPKLFVIRHAYGRLIEYCRKIRPDIVFSV